MTVSVIDGANGPYFPNGVTTDFPFDFKVAATDEISVILISAPGVETVVSASSYNVTLAIDDEGGTISFLAAPVDDGRELWVVTNPSFQQQILFEDEGPFNSAVLNPLADRSAIRDIWLREMVSRSITLPRAGAPLDAAKGKFPYVDLSGQVVFVDGSAGAGGAALIASLLGVLSVSAVASEAIAAGDFVNLYDSGGVFSMRRAIANDASKWAHGFCSAAVALGAVGVSCHFGLNTHVIPAGNASEVWLSDAVPGGYSTVPPGAGGSIIQPLGVAIAGSGVFFTPRERVLL